MEIDPICLMELDEENVMYVSEYKGQKIYFCAPECKRAFDANPQMYL